MISLFAPSGDSTFDWWGPTWSISQNKIRKYVVAVLPQLIFRIRGFDAFMYDELFMLF